MEGAACVVEDVRTGEILASASYPTYSLPDFRKDYNSLLDDPLKPLNNRAFSGPVSPRFHLQDDQRHRRAGGGDHHPLHHHPG